MDFKLQRVNIPKSKKAFVLCCGFILLSFNEKDQLFWKTNPYM